MNTYKIFFAAGYTVMAETPEEAKAEFLKKRNGEESKALPYYPRLQEIANFDEGAVYIRLNGEQLPAEYAEVIKTGNR